MDKKLEQINLEILKCNNDNTLNKEIKKIRLEILKTYVKSLESKNYSNELKNRYMDLGALLSENTKGEVFLDMDLEQALNKLKNYILNPKIINFLDSKNIKVYNFKELKNYLYLSSDIDTDTLKNISIAIDLYEMINSMIDNIRRNIYNISTSLDNIIGDGILNKCTEYYCHDKGKKMVLTRKAKTSNELKDSKEKAEQKLKELLNKGIISKDIYNYSIELIKEVFNYYLNGLPIVPINNYADLPGIAFNKI